MQNLNNIEDENKDEKWDFEDYAFTVATVLCVVPIVLGILIAVGDSYLGAADEISFGSIHRWWPFSWMSFMFAWSICAIKDVIDIKRRINEGDLKDSAEYALYVTATTILLLIGIVQGQMQSSWLAGPIVFVIFTVIWPVLRNTEDKAKSRLPIIPVIIFVAGVVLEVVLGGWIAFPVSWILISTYKLCEIIAKQKFSEDVVVDIAYHAFTIILLTTSLIWGSWVISWLAYPISVIIGKIISKLRGKPATEKE